MKTALIFPAFVSEYHGTEISAIREFGIGLDRLLEDASEMLGTRLTDFDPVRNNFLEDELRSQYVSYIYSCAMAGILSHHGFRPASAAGYSMGIYAALYHCGAIGFRDGLKLIRKAWELISDSCREGEYGMGMIIGLAEEEIGNWCAEVGNVWICNRNNPHTYIVSGEKPSVSRVLELSAEEGALKANPLRVSKPYHSPLLEDAGERFGAFLEGFPIRPAQVPCISGIDQKILRTEGEIRHELARNICSRMNWMESVKYLSGQGIELFFECGAGDGLTKNNRFIEGGPRSIPAHQVRRFLDETGKG
jgi:[acyl-carrier-protein] S-malonyltransferase